MLVCFSETPGFALTRSVWYSSSIRPTQSGCDESHHTLIHVHPFSSRGVGVSCDVLQCNRIGSYGMPGVPKPHVSETCEMFRKHVHVS